MLTSLVVTSSRAIRLTVVKNTLAYLKNQILLIVTSLRSTRFFRMYF